MTEKTDKPTNAKPRLHPRNKHRSRYDFGALIESCPPLKPFVKTNIHNDESIDFFDPAAVKMLNKALLKHHYGVENWDIPPRYLCPPIPGRADYLHYIADLLAIKNNATVPIGNKVHCLDIGVGANCVYPLIGFSEFGWSFVGTDIDPVSIKSANAILNENPIFRDNIEIRLQTNPQDIFKGVIKENEHFDLTICNPPFHASQADAAAGSIRKINNLRLKKTTKPILNFGGKHNELWCEGGEVNFVQTMVAQSVRFSNRVFWFSTLISKEPHLKRAYEALNLARALEVKTVPMGQGNKTGRIVAWTFLTRKEQEKWAAMRWSLAG